MPMNPFENIQMPEMPDFRRVLLATLLASTVLSGLAQRSSNAPMVVESGQPPIVYDADHCIAPTAAEMAAVTNAANKPANPAFANDNVGSGNDGSANITSAEAARQQIAEKYGLTVHAEGQAIAAQLQAEDTDGHLPYTVYLEMAQEYMAQFGIDVRLANSSDKLDDGGRPLTAQELSGQGIKSTLLDILTVYSRLPVELIQISGQKHIILDGGMKQDGVAAYAVVTGAHDTNVYDVTVDVSQSTVTHELGHLIHTALCGSANIDHDDALAEIIGGLSLYQGLRYNSLSTNMFGVETRRVVMFDDMSQALAQDDVQRACQILGDYNQLVGQEATVDGYDPTTAEEAAQIFTLILNPDRLADGLDTAHPMIREQAMLMLGRLYALNPNVVRYLLETGTRPVAQPASGGVCTVDTIQAQISMFNISPPPSNPHAAQA